jgi:hypothetical protein
MSMSKQDFIALADTIREHNRVTQGEGRFSEDHIDTLADFCASQNYAFKRERWLMYLKGECGPNGGSK